MYGGGGLVPEWHKAVRSPRRHAPGAAWASLAPKVAGVTSIVLLALLGLRLLLGNDSNSNSALGPHPELQAWGPSSTDTSQGHHARDILVLYVLSNGGGDPEYYDNFKFFLREAIEKDEGKRCQFLIMVDTEDQKALNPLPKLPPHAQYVEHSLECYDWGLYGWVLNNRKLVQDLGLYAYVFLINCSARGPYIPPMLQGAIPWYEPFLAQMGTRDVRLVGSAVSCDDPPQAATEEAEGSPARLPDEQDQKAWTGSPHLQSFALAMDKVGLQTLLDDGRVFQCHQTLWDTVRFSELGASRALLRAGHNLGSLMIRYWGLDFRDRNNWGCNGGLSPGGGESFYDGINLDPYEIVFVKVNSGLLRQRNPPALHAKKYDYWMHNASLSTRVTANAFIDDSPQYRVPKILEKLAHGEKCFDKKYYLRRNPDLQEFHDNGELWHHFVYFGQFEPRMYRFLCPLDVAKYAGLAAPKRKLRTSTTSDRPHEAA